MLSLFVLSEQALSSPEEKAVRAALEAGYKQSGLEDRVGEFIKDSLTKEEERLYGKYGILIKVIIDKKAEYQWTW